MSEKNPAKTTATKPRATTAKTTKVATRTATRKTAPAAIGGKSAAWTACAVTRHGIDLQARIRQRAYELWERDGRPEGRDHAHWHQAEREIGAAPMIG
jgi:Protein of unknown function (DUF2934)